MNLSPAHHFQSITGKGVRGVVEGREVFVGREVVIDGRVLNGGGHVLNGGALNPGTPSAIAAAAIEAAAGTASSDG